MHLNKLVHASCLPLPVPSKQAVSNVMGAGHSGTPWLAFFSCLLCPPRRTGWLPGAGPAHLSSSPGFPIAFLHTPTFLHSVAGHLVEFAVLQGSAASLSGLLTSGTWRQPAAHSQSSASVPDLSPRGPQGLQCGSPQVSQRHLERHEQSPVSVKSAHTLALHLSNHT